MQHAGTVLTGISATDLLEEAFTAASTAAADRPFSVLCLTQQDDRHDQYREQWTSHHGPTARLRLLTLDEFVNSCYQRISSHGRESHIRQGELYRLVELALEHDLTESPLHGGRPIPGAGPTRHAEQLLSLVRFGGLLSPTDIEQGLDEYGLGSRGATVARLQAAFDDRRERLFDAPLTTRAERYDRVANHPDSLASVFDAVDAVIFVGFSQLSALDTAVIDRIQAAHPTVFVHPLVSPPDQSTDADSWSVLDRGTLDVVDRLTDTGFDHEYRGVEELRSPADQGQEESHDESRAQPRTPAVQDLYRHHEQESTTELSGVSIYEAPTPTDEQRYIARDIRGHLLAGVDPESITVYLPNRGEEARHLAVTCRQYDVPVSVEAQVGLPETAVGGAVEAVLSLAESPATPNTIVDLLTNPLVDLGDDGALAETVSDIATRLATPQLERLLDALDTDAATRLNRLVTRCQTIGEKPLSAAIDTLRAILDEIGLPTGVEHIEESTRLTPQLESRAIQTLRTELAALDAVATAYDADQASIQRLRRTIRLAEVSGTRGEGTRSVRIRSLSAGTYDDSDIVYVPGLTAEQFPDAETELRFSRPITDADETFATPDPGAVAEQALACLLATTETVTLSRPLRTLDGDEFVIAPILRELRRVTGLAGDPLPNQQPGAFEDLQREAVSDLGATSQEIVGVNEIEDSIDAISANESVSTAQTQNLRDGVSLATHRKAPGLTRHDGVLDESIVASLHDQSDRYPLSPSRIERYAGCGFRYYMTHILGFEEAPGITDRLDHLERGKLIHKTLAAFLDGISGDGPVDPATHSRASLEETLLDVALEQVSAIDPSDSLFEYRWLETVLSGLGTPAENPYYADDRSLAGSAGLLIRFLDREHQLWDYTKSRPWLAEQRIGASTGGQRQPLQDDPMTVQTPHGPVSIHGMVDRIDRIDSSDIDGVGIAVRDYKTGSTPNGADTIEGVQFQLPVYALLAEHGLALETEAETIAGAYYRVKPPRDVVYSAGQIGSETYISHAYANEDTPLSHFNSGHRFETHDEFRAFLTETIPERLGAIDAGISAGVFAPTFLTAADAGCRNCSYSEACDVRHERRLEKADAVLSDETSSAYIPARVRETVAPPSTGSTQTGGED